MRAHYESLQAAKEEAGREAGSPTEPPGQLERLSPKQRHQLAVLLDTAMLKVRRCICNILFQTHNVCKATPPSERALAISYECNQLYECGFTAGAIWR